jgi:Tol biopolymer transport system component
MISSGGGALRSLAVAHFGSFSGPPLFSADGARLLIPYAAAGTPDGLHLALASVRSGPAHPIPEHCLVTPAWSRAGDLLACPVDRGHVSVFDLHGRVRFTVPGNAALWSSDGRLAISDATRTTVLSASGRAVARLLGVAAAWSPDGRSLALIRPGALVLVQPGGGNATRVVYRGADSGITSAAFTPDGRDISYSGSKVEPSLAPVAGGPATRLAAGFAGTWSRDGRYAFAYANGTKLTIKVGDRYGHGARVVGQFPFDDHGDFALAWLGDGSRLLYGGSTRDHSDLWAMAADGSGQHRLTSNGHAISSPAWSADGTKLAYATAGFTGGLCGYCGGSVGVADAEGHQLSLVPGAIAGQESADGTPAWSPSGAQLAVTNDYNAGVYAVGLDGSGRTRLAPDAAGSPAWSPDGTTVAYVANFGGGAIWEVDPSGANPRPLLAPSLKAFSLAWSPDGKQLAFSTATGVYVAAVDGSSPPLQVAAAKTPGRPSFSPDGQWLAFAAQTGGSVHPYSAIYVVGADGSALQQLTTGPLNSAEPAWQPAPATTGP